MTIQRLVLDFRGEGGDLLVRCLYRTQDAPGQIGYYLGTCLRPRVGVASRKLWRPWMAAPSTSEPQATPSGRMFCWPHPHRMH